MIRCGRFSQTLICLSVSKMVSNHTSELFSLLDFSWSEAFVCLNHHKFGVLIDKANSPVLIREEIVVYRFLRAHADRKSVVCT